MDKLVSELCEKINRLPFEEKIEALNSAREALHKISPFNNEPCDCITWVRQEKVLANDYNPNHVATPEMRLLHRSIKADGYTMPVVTCKINEYERRIVDGFHRNRVAREYSEIRTRVFGYLPVSTIDKPYDECIGSTIRHNRARGTHGIRPMSDIVLELTSMGWDDERICKNLGMEYDEVIRLKQISGLKEAFSNHSFSRSWEEFEYNYNISYKKNSPN